MKNNETKEYLESQIKVGEFVGTSGKLLKSYIDCRRLIVDKKTAYSIGYDLIRLISNYIPRPIYQNIGAIGGATFAGSHLAQVISEINVVPGIPWFAFHSKKNQLYLPFEKIKKCVIVDDVLTTGSTFNRMILTIQNENIYIQGIYVIIDRRETQEDIMGIKVSSLFRMTEDGILY